MLARLKGDDKDNSPGHFKDITPSPLTQFVVIISSLVHDVDHPGVSNSTLVAEQAPIATKYNNKSVAENNSIDIAMNILMEDKYRELRDCIDPDDVGFERFAKLLVTVVLATDVLDGQLKAARDARWDTVFDETHQGPNKDHDRAILVLEHLIQASDICHTMQHWIIFRKWNERLFSEMVTAYQAGRTSAHPADFWYKGELGFFDHYVIPLARKLQECEVFGVSSDEYLNYALANRAEWDTNGQAVVAAMVEKYGATEPSPSTVESQGEEDDEDVEELKRRIRDRLQNVRKL